MLADTAADSHWSQENAAKVLAARGWPADKVQLCRRWFNGQIEPSEMLRTLMRLGPAYYDRPGLARLAHDMLSGGWRSIMTLRAEPLIYAGRQLMPGWSVRDRLAGIRVPTLVIGGASDFIFPPEAQVELSSGIPGARL